MLFCEVTMPPKVKITKSDIIQTSISLIRSLGYDALNTRNIAKELDCSTQPIFSNFASMEELEKEVFLYTYNIYLSFIESETLGEKYPKYKAFGMAYIKFAQEEKELFKLLFMSDRKGKDFIPTNDFDQSIQMIMQANDVPKELATKIHVEMWAFVHGIAVMLATSFVTFEWTFISDMVTDIYQGLRARHVIKEDFNDSNKN